MKEQQPLIAIVTGGASGIGLAIAEKFCQHDIFTIVIGRDSNKLKAAQDMLGQKGKTIQFDLTDLKKIPSLVNDIKKEFGRIDVLVNNAGINMKKEFTEVSDEDFQTILHTNVNAMFSLSREVVKVMEAQGSGSIINISSMASQYGIPKVNAYTASKSAIEGMTNAMAVELSPKGIRVNAIAPGFITTAMTAKAFSDDPERMNKAMGRTPMGKFGLPADIGDAAVFLASDAARYITGVILPVDGGNSIGF